MIDKYIINITRLTGVNKPINVSASKNYIPGHKGILSLFKYTECFIQGHHTNFTRLIFFLRSMKVCLSLPVILHTTDLSGIERLMDVSGQSCGWRKNERVGREQEGGRE